MTAHPKANPKIKSAEILTYVYRVEHLEPRPTKVQQIEITDYRGQSGQDLAARRLQEMHEDKTPPVSTVIWMVDLFPASPHGQSTRAADAPDMQHVNKQMDQIWGIGAINAWRGLTGNTDKFWVLFINKVDLLIGEHKEVKILAEQAFDPLRQRLAALSAGRDFRVIVGSTSAGLGVPELAQLLSDPDGIINLA